MKMNRRKINDDYFLKKTKSKINLRKNKTQIANNKLNRSKKNINLYEEEKNYNIESTKTIDSKQKNDESISINNKKSKSLNKSKNINEFNTIDSKIKSNSYIRNLEDQLKSQKKQLTQLLEYKNICEKRIKSLSPEEVFPLTIDSLNPNFYTNRSERNIRNISKETKENIIYGNTFDIESQNNEEEIYKIKYNNLFSKYSQIIKENKNFNINIMKLKNIIEKQKSENEYLINILESKNKENINDNNSNENINELKQQAETFRRDLVLSQAIVNSLKSEIEILNRNKSIQKEFNSENNKNNYLNNLTNNERNDLINENNILKKSLTEKNLLITNLLEENYKLNETIKSYGININNNAINNIKTNKNENNISLIKEMKNVISQYENKFGFFNDYINKIKKELNLLYKNINQIIKDNNYKKGINNKQNKFILSDNFYQKINDIKKQMKDINIDLYNLDYSNEIKGINIYKKLIGIFNEELKKLILIHENFNLIKEKENKSIEDLLSLAKNLISDNMYKKYLTDIFHKNRKINQLYKQKILHEQDNNNIDQIILNQEMEIEKKRKYILNNSNIRKTYYVTSNSKKKSKSKINNENMVKNIHDYNYKNNKKNYYRNNKSLEEYKFSNTYKKSSYSRDKINIMRPNLYY